MTLVPIVLTPTVVFAVIVVVAVMMGLSMVERKRESENYKRGLSLVALMIHLPPATDDINIGGRDERDVTNEAISEAQIMYSIIASTAKSGWKSKIYGQKHISFEIVATNGLIKYYTLVPVTMVDTVKQAIVSAYPTARLEEVERPNIFSKNGGSEGVAGGELELKKDFMLPIATYEEMKWDATGAILNALSKAKAGEGMSLQVLFRPADKKWVRKSSERVQNIKNGKKSYGAGLGNGLGNLGAFMGDLAEALWKPPAEREKEKGQKELSNSQLEEIKMIEEKTKYPGFEVLIRIIASTGVHSRSEALVGGVVSAFAQFDLANGNGFKYNILKDSRTLAKEFILRLFPQKKNSDILNGMELATIYHLPSQNVIPTSQVERQLMKQVDGPAKLTDEGLLLGVNEFRGNKKQIRLSTDDRRRHTYVIGQTGMGKSVLLCNLAYQDMMDGKGFAFIDPHGDAVEDILSKVPPERIDDVIYFDPGDVERPIGMNMFEFQTEDQKDFIVQEGINMLYSLYDPGHTGIFGPRGEHMFRNAALLLMSDPEGATFIDIPKVFIDPEFVKEKLKYVTDKNVYDYWTKEFPASQKSNDAGEVTTWFVSKWGPFLSNTMMRNVLGQTKSGFNIREVMDGRKILLVNLSKGKLGELNSKLLGMIFVMKFQTAAMSRVDTPEKERKDFCLFVDEFQNFSTESFESILSEARKFRLNLVLANQFMTQLTDKIREGILGNVGTILCGRIGITDAEMMEKAFSPVFNAEDLTKQPNHHAVAKVLMFGLPASPFTMSLVPPMGDRNNDLLESLRGYSAMKYARSRAEVNQEIERRLSVQKVEEVKNTAGGDAESFLNGWKEKRREEERRVETKRKRLGEDVDDVEKFEKDTEVEDEDMREKDLAGNGEGLEQKKVELDDGKMKQGEVIKFR